MRHPLRLIAAGAVIASALVAAPASHAATTAPKAYIGLFKDNAVAVYDTTSNSVMKTIPIPTGPHGLVVTPDGSRVLVAGFGTDSVEAIDTSTNQVLWQTPVPQPHNIAITADGQTAYAGGQKDGQQQIAIIDVATGTETGSVPLDHSPRALAITPDGAELTYTLAGVDALQVLDLNTLQLDTQLPTGVSPHHPLFTPDGKVGMVVAQGPGELDLFDPATFIATGSVKVGTMPHWIGQSSDGRWVYVTNENSNDLSVIDMSDRSLKATIQVGNAPRKIVVQPGAASAADISIASFAFSPKSATVNAGQKVTVTNSDSVTHTFTSTTWDSGDIQPGAAFTLTAPSEAGTFAYHCSIHPFMVGTLVVQ